MKLGELLGDPLYLYEARRYWTTRRYAGAGALLLGWWAVLFLCVFGNRKIPSGGDPGAIIIIVVWCSIVGRMPLSYLAATGAALSIVPERVSGQLEQFVLTPMDPWRLGLARYAARLRGLASIWLVVGAIAVASLITVVAVGAADMGMADPRFGMLRDQLGISEWAVLVAVCGSVLMGQLGLAVMIMLDAAVGLTFSARMRSTAAAVALACLVSFPLLGFMLNVPGGIISAWASFAMMLSFRAAGSGLAVLTTLIPLFAGLVHLGLGVLALGLFLRWARGSVTTVFSRPREA